MPLAAAAMRSSAFSQRTRRRSPNRLTAKRKKHAGAYLASLSVQGFRGIGPKQTLTLNPAPGLTVIIGRNGSGKSSFAEALEVLFTGDSKRWSDRPKIWKEGWRSLHNAHPAGVTAEVLFEGEGTASVCCTWDEGAELDEQKAFVQPKGKPKTTLEQLGWRDAVVSYRPFLSYNELGSLLDEGPSKLYDALSLVLGPRGPGDCARRACGESTGAAKDTRDSNTWKSSCNWFHYVLLRPILTFNPGQPNEGSFFGPVISNIPRGDDALKLWDAIEVIATSSGVSELKRSNRARPNFD